MFNDVNGMCWNPMRCNALHHVIIVQGILMALGVWQGILAYGYIYLYIYMYINIYIDMYIIYICNIYVVYM